MHNFYNDETNTHSTDIPTIGTIHKALAVTRAFSNIYPDCEICSMEEFIISKLVSYTNIYGIQWAKRKTDLYFFKYKH